jgi:periplasmic protein TonB
MSDPQRAANRAAAEEATGLLDLFTDEGRRDGRRLRYALIAAVGVHLALFGVDFPAGAAKAFAPAAKPRVYVIQQVRFRPPPPQPPVETHHERTRIVPIPDPTPDGPEPLRVVDELAPPDIDLTPGDFVYIPDAPPAPPADPVGPLPVGGEVTRPVKISGPEPAYSELARRARIQGQVIVRATIDAEGRVTDLRLLKTLPMGLGDSTLAAVGQWRFTPGTLRGKPVPVLYDLTVIFGLN